MLIYSNRTVAGSDYLINIPFYILVKLNDSYTEWLLHGNKVIVCISSVLFTYINSNTLIKHQPYSIRVLCVMHAMMDISLQ